jgi:hypothetical protein
MRPGPREWDCLRLAAKAADRVKAGEVLRPTFEERLRALGYSSLAIAHAHSTLTGPGTVEEALVELKEHARLERTVPVPLKFEVVEREPGLPGHRALTITAVERAACGIRITYEIRPPLGLLTSRLRVEARDDCDQAYSSLGASLGLAGWEGRTVSIGSFGLPIPEEHASLLRVRMSWSRDPTSLWERPGHEMRITL